jgi:predicted dehydrogenase
MNTLRFGILGAARIAPAGLVYPAADVAGIELACVAARDPARARVFAAEHDIPVVLDSYADVIAADVDAIYIALPISAHHDWTLAALAAGKHVLCEKALANNAREAAAMAAAADQAGCLLMEAFHYRYHPLFLRVLELLRAGAIGQLRRIEGDFAVPHIHAGDIRLDFATGGGGLMDLGTYPVHWLRHVSGLEPEVRSATARTGPAEVDIVMEAELGFPGAPHLTGRIRSSMDPAEPLVARLVIEGDDGRMVVTNPLAPQMGHDLLLENAGGTLHEQVDRTPSYTYQLEAFATAVRDGTPVPTDGHDGTANMRVIDAIYRAAGLRLRGT